ncbi:MAG: APC family permease [Firmicutes bacterium]|nr:APC family permease [Bacillota bacterium]
MAAGGMIAAWMVEMIYWFELSGTGCFIALLVSGVLVIPLALCYSELSGMLPLSGGENVWVSNAFNWDVGYFFNWLLYLMYILAMPTVAFGISTMASYFAPLPFEQVRWLALAVLLVWYFISNIRIKFLGIIQNIMFTVMVVISLGVVVLFVTSGQWSFSNLTPWFPQGFKGFYAAVGILVFKYIGFDMIPQLSEEANFPRNQHWKAYLGAMAITFIVYGAAIIGNAGVVGTEWILNTDIIDPRIADLLGMHWAAWTVVIAGILGTVTTLTGFWLAASRSLLGGSLQKQLPAVLQKINSQGQPWAANIVVAVFSIFFTVLAPIAWVEYIYTIYALIAGVVYLMVALSFVILRRTKPEWERPYKVPYAPLLGAIAVIFPIWVITASLSEIDPRSLAIIGSYFAVGIVIYIYVKVMQKKYPEEWAPYILTPKDIKEEKALRSKDIRQEGVNA